MIKIILNGATGKMGRLAAEHIRKSDDLQLVAELSSNDNLATAIKKFQPDIVL
ncbi:MAG: 4-hydroxy-tetrahydrodipicolinate reductase, partial [Gammaproteobacteria bacterium]|nr:4-hydroxy-tetrahydrodipicolinate reductase [Gammaproteobacteria bacterium]